MKKINYKKEYEDARGYIVLLSFILLFVTLLLVLSFGYYVDREIKLSQCQENLRECSLILSPPLDTKKQIEETNKGISYVNFIFNEKQITLKDDYGEKIYPETYRILYEGEIKVYEIDIPFKRITSQDGQIKICFTHNLKRVFLGKQWEEWNEEKVETGMASDYKIKCYRILTPYHGYLELTQKDIVLEDSRFEIDIIGV